MLLSPWYSTFRVDFHKYSLDFVYINEQNFILSCLSSWVDVGNCLLGILESDPGCTSLDSEEDGFLSVPVLGLFLRSISLLLLCSISQVSWYLQVVFSAFCVRLEDRRKSNIFSLPSVLWQHLQQQLQFFHGPAPAGQARRSSNFYWLTLGPRLQ